jgi:ADP-ribosylglycohydrolase
VEQAGETANVWYRREPFERELCHFSRILEGDVAGLEEPDVRSGGYVVHTLEAALWCLLNESSFAATVLRAVNLGEDTDTTGAVAGGLAGLFYGYEAVPGECIDRLARTEDILHLARRFARAAGGRPDA